MPSREVAFVLLSFLPSSANEWLRTCDNLLHGPWLSWERKRKNQLFICNVPSSRTSLISYFCHQPISLLEDQYCIPVGMVLHVGLTFLATYKTWTALFVPRLPCAISITFLFVYACFLISLNLLDLSYMLAVGS